MRRTIIIIPIGEQATQNTWVTVNIDPLGGENTFTVGLVSVADPDSGITHYWCNWGVLSESEYDELSSHFSAIDGANFYDGDIWTPQQCLDDYNLQLFNIGN